MEPSVNPEVQELPLGVPRFRRKAAAFLESNSLRLEEVDLFLAILDENGEILAAGGLRGDVIKCIAVRESARREGLAAPLVSRLVSEAFQRDVSCVKVFTKPSNTGIFTSLGFRVLAQAPQAVLMENGRGLEDYCRELGRHRGNGTAGLIVMNANPFTLGHLHLVREAASRVDRLFVIPVAQEGQRFSYAERLEMIRRGCGEMATVVPGSAYQISEATFPNYFLKDLSEASETQMRLDIDLFCRHIAPALGINRRFVGSEPLDPLTAHYNAIMAEMLPAAGIELIELPRLCDADGPISASRVREALDAGSFRLSSALTPPSSHPCLLAELAQRALRQELDTPLKPGLVGPDSSGAHSDMDYALMNKGIAAIRPFFPQMVLAETPEALRQLGIDAEKAMLAATGGVNTHRGAIFALGLALHAFGQCKMETPVSQGLMQKHLCEIAGVISSNSLTTSELHFTPQGLPSVKDAREMARGGYQELFDDWLPFYRSVKEQPYALQRTLLHIMSSLDDTCIIHRAGYDRAQQVKREAAELLKIAGQAGNDGKGAGNDGVRTFDQKLHGLCDRYAAEGISPGGCADMLSLTLFADSIISNHTNH